MRTSLRVALLASLLIACDGATMPEPDAGPEPDLRFVAVTFNTGTAPELPHDGPPDDGYTQEMAELSDLHYGNGLAWLPAVDAATFFLANLQPDVIVFQEIFHPEDCAAVPAPARAGFICGAWRAGDPTVAQRILGAGYQVLCNLGKPDKCAAVRRSFGNFRGCTADLCLDGLDGAQVPGCGSGSRIGRGVIDIIGGGSITLVNVHGSSGIEMADQDCRTQQFDQVFVDLDGAPAASGELNLILGDFNTDPERLASGDPSAARLVEHVDGERFHFVNETDRRADPTYAGLFNIDHVISDGLDGECWAAGITEGHPAVVNAVYFDHVPIVCELSGDLP